MILTAKLERTETQYQGFGSEDGFDDAAAGDREVTYSVTGAVTDRYVNLQSVLRDEGEGFFHVGLEQLEEVVLRELEDALRRAYDEAALLPARVEAALAILEPALKARLPASESELETARLRKAAALAINVLGGLG